MTYDTSKMNKKQLESLITQDSTTIETLQDKIKALQRQNMELTDLVRKKETEKDKVMAMLATVKNLINTLS